MKYCILNIKPLNTKMYMSTRILAGQYENKITSISVSAFIQIIKLYAVAFVVCAAADTCAVDYAYAVIY